MGDREADRGPLDAIDRATASDPGCHLEQNRPSSAVAALDQIAGY